MPFEQFDALGLLRIETPAGAESESAAKLWPVPRLRMHRKIAAATSMRRRRVRFIAHLPDRWSLPWSPPEGAPPPPEVFDYADGAVGVDEGLVGDAANVGFRDLVDAVDRAEQFAPVAVAVW